MCKVRGKFDVASKSKIALHGHQRETCCGAAVVVMT